MEAVPDQVHPQARVPLLLEVPLEVHGKGLASVAEVKVPKPQGDMRTKKKRKIRNVRENEKEREKENVNESVNAKENERGRKIRKRVILFLKNRNQSHAQGINQFIFLKN